MIDRAVLYTSGILICMTVALLSRNTNDIVTFPYWKPKFHSSNNVIFILNFIQYQMVDTKEET